MVATADLRPKRPSSTCRSSAPSAMVVPGRRHGSRVPVEHLARHGVRSAPIPVNRAGAMVPLEGAMEAATRDPAPRDTLVAQRSRLAPSRDPSGGAPAQPRRSHLRRRGGAARPPCWCRSALGRARRLRAAFAGAGMGDWLSSRRRRDPRAALRAEGRSRRPARSSGGARPAAWRRSAPVGSTRRPSRPRRHRRSRR